MHKRRGIILLFILFIIILLYGVSQLNSIMDIKDLRLMWERILIVCLIIFILIKTKITRRQLQEVSNKLVAADKLKNEFMIKAYYDVGIPINRIYELIQMLMDTSGENTKLTQQERLIGLYEQTNILKQLLEDLRNRASVNTKKMNLDILAFPICELKGVIEECNLFLKEDQQVKIIDQLTGYKGFIQVDGERSKQVLFNLLYYAIKNTQKGEIKISAHTADKMIYIDVSSTGLEIYEEKLLEKIDFFENNSDFGVGLGITKALIEEMGGTLSVSTGNEKVSGLTFSLPVGHGEIEHKEVRNHEIYKSSFKLEGINRKNILLVSDCKQSLIQQANYLNLEGYTIFATLDEEVACSVLKKEKVDLLLIELSVCCKQEGSFYQTIQHRYNSVELPVIIMTAIKQISVVQKELELKRGAFVIKPIERSEILKKIEVFISIKETAQQALFRELKYYQDQITPHFLYNTINTIIGLSYTDTRLAREALQNLAIYFRGKLDFESYGKLIPLSKELELARAYVAIEQVRFKEDLEVTFDIEEGVEVLIPALTLQPLIENAIVHGLRQAPRKGKIILSVCDTQRGQVEIRIKDMGVGMTKEQIEKLVNSGAGGIGFSNVQKKINLLHGSDLKIVGEKGKGTEIIILLLKEDLCENYTSRR